MFYLLQQPVDLEQLEKDSTAEGLTLEQVQDIILSVSATTRPHGRNFDLGIQPLTHDDLAITYDSLAKATQGFRQPAKIPAAYVTLGTILENHLTKTGLLERRKRRDLYAVPTWNRLQSIVLEKAEIVRTMAADGSIPPLHELGFVVGIDSYPADEEPKLFYGLHAEEREGTLQLVFPQFGFTDHYTKRIFLSELVSYTPIGALR
ncbi:MAG TPA: hypothetical protein VJB87_01800 [Candidatus Nanoarchaeia archaeon]|nr:hypothetical protein [Candidatus Nanoarchaeia archaeon]